eukprot:9494866-Pyramimonas_sp.AAC.1
MASLRKAAKRKLGGGQGKKEKGPEGGDGPGGHGEEGPEGGGGHEEHAVAIEAIDDVDVGGYVEALEEWEDVVADAAGAAAGAAAPAAAADPPPAAPGADGPVGAAGGLPTVVEHDDTRRYFFNPENDKDRWGRLTLMHVGEPREAISMYCNAHGCSRVRCASDFPRQQVFRQWLKDGRDLPFGKAGKAEHLRMFDRLPKP